MIRKLLLALGFVLIVRVVASSSSSMFVTCTCVCSIDVCLEIFFIILMTGHRIWAVVTTLAPRVNRYNHPENFVLLLLSLSTVYVCEYSSEIFLCTGFFSQRKILCSKEGRENNSRWLCLMLVLT